MILNRYNLLIILMGLLVFPLFAQSERDSLNKRPYLTITGEQADPLSLLLLNTEKIKSISVFAPGDASEWDKKTLPFGVVDVVLHKKAYPIGLKKLVDFYHLNDTVNHLPIIVAFGFSPDKLYVQQPDLLMISIEEVLSVEIRRSFLHRKPELYIIKKDPFRQRKESELGTRLDSINNLFQYEARKRYHKDTVIVGML